MKLKFGTVASWRNRFPVRSTTMPCGSFCWAACHCQIYKNIELWI